MVLQSYFFGVAKLLFWFCKAFFGCSTAKICLNPVLMSMNYNGGVANLGSSDSILIQAIYAIQFCNRREISKMSIDAEKIRMSLCYRAKYRVTKKILYSLLVVPHPDRSGGTVNSTRTSC